MSKADELITRVLERDARATPGPWRTSPATLGDPGDGPTMYRVYQETAQIVFLLEYNKWAEANADLIAGYRGDAPALARMLQRAMVELANHETLDGRHDNCRLCAAYDEIEAMA